MKNLNNQLIRDNSPPNILRQQEKYLQKFKPKLLKIMTTLKTLCILTLLFSLNINSQITKGNWMVGGSGYFSTSKSESTSSFSTNVGVQSGIGFQIQPNIGYFIDDKFVVGLSPSIGFSRNNDNKSSGIWFYGGGPFARYYLLKSDNRVNILTHIGYYYSKDNDNKSSYNNFVGKIGPVLYFNSSVALELTANYSVDTFRDPNYKTVNNDFSIRIGLQIHLEK